MVLGGALTVRSRVSPRDSGRLCLFRGGAAVSRRSRWASALRAGTPPGSAPAVGGVAALGAPLQWVEVCSGGGLCRALTVVEVVFGGQRA